VSTNTKTAEILELSSDELVDRLAEARRELFNLRFQLATGQLDNTARMGQVRKDIARVLTVLRDREISEAEALAESEGEAR
jgi:large subunit ribosomal protein L29